MGAGFASKAWHRPTSTTHRDTSTYETGIKELSVDLKLRDAIPLMDYLF